MSGYGRCVCVIDRRKRGDMGRGNFENIIALRCCQGGEIVRELYFICRSYGLYLFIKFQ